MCHIEHFFARGYMFLQCIDEDYSFSILEPFYCMRYDAFMLFHIDNTAKLPETSSM